MTYGSAHYWASEDLNTTGENVGITLDSMCDIIMANDVTSGNTVVFIPGDIEHGQKGHFALGEGGGGSAEIDASIYQVIVGDGEGNGVGAQGGAEAQEANKIYLKNKRLGPNIPTCEDDGTPIQDVDTGSFTIASNGLGHTHTETVHDEDLDEDVEVQVEDDGWKATIEDLAKVLATGKSKVEIGEKDADYNLTFWGDTLNGPDIKIKGAAKIEMLEKAIETDNPGITAISMRGNSLIDMSNEKRFDYSWNMGWHFSSSADAHHRYIRSVSPFSNQDSGPILQLKGSPTVEFLDQAVVKAENGSCLEIGGNARVHIVGGEWAHNTQYDNPATQNAARVNINVGPGFWSELYGSLDGQFYSVLNMNPGTMILSTQMMADMIPSYNTTSINSSGFEKCFYHGSNYRNTGTPLHTFDGSTSYNQDWNIFHLRRLEGHNNITTQDNPTPNSSSPAYDPYRITGQLASPVFSMSNNTLLSITSGDIGGVAIGIGTSPGGTINADITSGGYFNIKAGLEGSATMACDFGAQGGSDTGIKLCFEPSSRTRIACELAGNTSIKFNPRKAFGFFCGAEQTEMNWEWQKFYGLFGGHDVFAQVDGNTHLESWSGTVILRGSNNMRDYNGSDTNRSRFYPYFPSPTKTRSNSGSITVNADLSEMSISDIETTYSSQLKSATQLPSSNDEFEWVSFSGTSKTKLPIKYGEKLTIYNISCVGNLSYMYLEGDYDTYEEIYNSQEFRDYAKEKIKAINTPTFGNIYTEGVITSKTYIESQGKYSYSGTFPVNITNITIEIKPTPSGNPINEAISQYKIATQMSYPGGRATFNKIFSNNGMEYNFQKIAKSSNAYCSYSTYTENQYNESISIENLTFNQTGGYYDYSITVMTSNYINLNNTTPQQFLQNAEVLTSLRSTFGNFTTVEPMDNVEVVYNRYQYSRYYYSLKHIILHYDSWPLTNTFYGSNDSDGALLNHPDEQLSSLPEVTQNTIKNKIGTSYTSTSYGTWDYSQAQFADDYAVTETVKYKVSTTSNYTGETETHLGKNWKGPIQTADRVGTKDWDKSPIIQAYGPVNICVREKYSPGLEYNATITTSENEFDLTDMNQAIRDFVASNHYQELLDYISNNYSGKELYYINRINATGSSTQYVVYFFLKENDWDLEVASTTNVPVVDVTEGSELRIYGGAKIKAVTKYGETTYEFSSADSDEEPVSFTLAELKALKQMLNNI